MEANVNFFKLNSKNKNTESATRIWVGNYQKRAVDNVEEECLENLEPEKLNEVLERYFSSVKKQTGGEYEPSSLANIQAAISRHLQDRGCTFNILKDIVFKGSRDVLEGRGRYLREELHMGQKPNRAEGLNIQEEEELWTSGLLGTQNPKALTNTIWFLLTQHFGLRGRQEHHWMKVEDFVERADEKGNRFITFAEGSTKTRQAGLRKKERLVVPKMFETGNPLRCPVMIFLLYLSKRPVELRKKGPIYLGIIKNPKSEIWYKSSNMGKNTINNLMKNMVEDSPLTISTKRFTNHSARKTLVKKLRKSFSKDETIEITGHSNTRGLDDYDCGDDAHLRSLSFAIDQASTSSHTITSRDAPPVAPVSDVVRALPSPPHVETPPSKEIPSWIKSRKEVASTPRNFNFFSEEQYRSFSVPVAPVMNFYNCNVTIGDTKEKKEKATKRKRLRIVSSPSSSGEEF